MPGLYPFAMNGIGMPVAAGLTAIRHRLARWLTGALGIWLIVWITVQLPYVPETLVLQWLFLATGIAFGVIALAWSRGTGRISLR